MEPIFNTYHGEGDLIAHIKDFDMKFKFKLGVDDNLMKKYFPTTLRGDALNWHFSLLAKYINYYTQLVSQF